MPVILRQLLSWLIAPKPLSGVVLCALLVTSAFGVIWSAHQTRNMYRDLQQLEKDHDDLEHEYEKLLLEHSAWADYVRLNEIARKELNMTAPKTKDMVVLQ